MTNAEYQRGCEEFAAQHWHSWDDHVAHKCNCPRETDPNDLAGWSAARQRDLERSVPLSDNPNLQFHLENRCYRAW
jgi:hypothetical protein